MAQYYKEISKCQERLTELKKEYNKLEAKKKEKDSDESKKNDKEVDFFELPFEIENELPFK